MPQFQKFSIIWSKPQNRYPIWNGKKSVKSWSEIPIDRPVCTSGAHCWSPGYLLLIAVVFASISCILAECNCILFSDTRQNVWRPAVAPETVQRGYETPSLEGGFHRDGGVLRSWLDFYCWRDFSVQTIALCWHNRKGTECCTTRLHIAAGMWRLS